ncbi:MAG: bifunctional phosphoribosylaminoimidazolecarboxamide formyltransferase/IMP cyclohydrolase [Chloroflexi bacterium]|nr:bifunctional phosphoribosylaminoimidazolecarboxamide formyltransferase/IMP cyclohydrolase [Chloroflexota bacterium]
MIAIVAVYDKTGIDEFAGSLAKLGFEIYSTGGTQKAIADAGVPVQPISDLTGFPEMLDGRVKTLHPKVHGGILARRDNADHMEQLREAEIAPIDLVCVNLYPFRETVAKPDVTEDDALENIDIGGPTMLRAAAKNYPSVLVLVDPSDYVEVLDSLRNEKIPLEFRRRLAQKAFQHVASYDTAIAGFLRGAAAHPTSASGRADRDVDEFPDELTVALEKVQDLRYGENPHLRGAIYRDSRPGAPQGIIDSERLHGLDMSYLNYFDADAAWRAVVEFERPTIVIVKHATPCGIASDDDIAKAYERAFDSDPVSPFGGIIAASQTVTWEMTAAMKGMRYDVIVAPDYEDRALERLKKRRDLRILKMPSSEGSGHAQWEYRSVLGGLLVQESDNLLAGDLELRVATKRAPTANELRDLRFAWTAVKYVKSNAIVFAKDEATVGIGAGQQNRRKPVELALELAGDEAKGAVVASDAFFPFAKDDAVEIACRAGVTAIIAPSGSVRDDETVEVCDEYGVALVFAGARAFRH